MLTNALDQSLPGVSSSSRQAVAVYLMQFKAKLGDNAPLTSSTKLRRMARGSDLWKVLRSELKNLEMVCEWKPSRGKKKVQTVFETPYQASLYPGCENVGSSAMVNYGRTSSGPCIFKKNMSLSDDSDLDCDTCLMNEFLMFALLSAPETHACLAVAYRKIKLPFALSPAFPRDSRMLMSFGRGVGVMENSGVSMSEAILDPKAFSLTGEHILRALEQVLVHLEVLQNILHFSHRDLHLGNVMLRKNGTVAFIDVAQSCANFKLAGANVQFALPLDCRVQETDFTMNRTYDVLIFCCCLHTHIAEFLETFPDENEVRFVQQKFLGPALKYAPNGDNAMLFANFAPIKNKSSTAWRRMYGKGVLERLVPPEWVPSRARARLRSLRRIWADKTSGLRPRRARQSRKRPRSRSI